MWKILIQFVIMNLTFSLAVVRNCYKPSFPLLFGDGLTDDFTLTAMAMNSLGDVIFAGIGYVKQYNISNVVIIAKYE